MSIQLQIDEMLDILEHQNHPLYHSLKIRAEDLAQAIACRVPDAVPELLPVGLAYRESTAFGGTCAPFRPREPGPVPAVLEHFDFEVQEWKDMCLEMAERVQLQDQA